MTTLIRYLLCLIVLLGCSGALVADTDEALLEDLEADLLGPDDQDDAPLDEMLLQNLGEDVGLEEQVKNKQLTKIVYHMKEARTLLKRLDSSRASLAQEEALSGLDAMIAELAQKKSQCSGGACKKPSKPKPDQKPGNQKKRGSNPAASATATKTELIDKSTSLVAVGDLVRDLWGHLPERQREQILQPLGSEYLPKYAAEIEAYFRDLAQPNQASRQNP